MMEEREPLGYEFARMQLERRLDPDQQIELWAQLPGDARIIAVRLKREGVEVEAEWEGETVKVLVG